MADSSTLPSVPTAADASPPGLASDHTSPMVDVQKHETLNTHTSDNLSSERSDEDAEGEPDEDFDTTMHTQLDEDESDDEEHSLSPRPGKRKKAVEEDDYMMKDPELYGLRRSVRYVLLLLDLPC
jgi:chromodomain-helicase-DNA-binding protein 1